MRAMMLVLAGGCIALGLAAPSVIQGLSRVLDSIPALAAGEPMSPSPRLWLTVPTGSAQVSPLLMAGWLVGIGVSVLSVIQVRGLRVRRAATWGCGRISQTPRMEYTASAFAEPLRRVFAELYRPTQDLSVSVHPESRYVVQSITYTSEVVPWFERVFYDPMIRSTRTLATQVRRLQAGSLHLYLLYVAMALLVALASAWWVK
jgi:hypothetical protein